MKQTLITTILITLCLAALMWLVRVSDVSEFNNCCK